MADIINLRRFRKIKARDQDDKVAEANRQKFGRTKSEKLLAKAEAANAAKLLDGHKRKPE